MASSSFADYVKWALDTPGAGVVIRNYQVVHLSDASFERGNIQLANATSRNLMQAKVLLASWPALGVVREFAASCRLFEAAYAGLVPNLRLSSIHENCSPGFITTEEEAVAVAREEHGETLFNRLYEANEFDLALYDFARRLFKQHLLGRTEQSLR